DRVRRKATPIDLETRLRGSVTRWRSFFRVFVFSWLEMISLKASITMRLSRALIVAVAALGVSLSAQAPVRTKPPSPGPAPALKLPALQKRQLANGLPAWLVELHEVPV